MTQHQAKYDVVHRRHVLDIRQKVRFLNSLIQWFSNCRTCTTGGTQGDLILRWVLEYSRSLCFQNWTKSTSTCSATSLCSTSLANDLMRWWCDVGLCFMQVIPEETIFLFFFLRRYASYDVWETTASVNVNGKWNALHLYFSNLCRRLQLFMVSDGDWILGTMPLQCWCLEIKKKTTLLRFTVTCSSTWASSAGTNSTTLL